MSDLIDRQQALEIKFSNAIVRRCAVYVRMDELVNKLNALPSVQPERTEEHTEMHACDLISRQAAIDGKISIQLANGVEIYSDEAVSVEYLKNLPTIQPEPSIPLSWVEEYIEWLKNLDNEFANLAAAHISVMVKKWRREQHETD